MEGSGKKKYLELQSRSLSRVGRFVEDRNDDWMSEISRSSNSDSDEFNLDVTDKRELAKLELEGQLSVTLGMHRKNKGRLTGNYLDVVRPISNKRNRRKTANDQYGGVTQI